MPSGYGAIISELISPTRYPKVPAAPNVNPQLAQQQTATGNYNVLPTLEATGRNLDAYNLGQRRAAVTGAVPNFDALTGTASNNLLSFLRGEVPQGVQDQLSLASLSKATAGGYGAAGNAGLPGAGRALEARDLGLNSLQLSQYGQGALGPYLSTLSNLLAPAGMQFNPESGFLSPGQTISANQWNEMNRYNTQAQENAIASLPNPLMRALGSALGNDFNSLLSVGGLLGTPGTANNGILSGSAGGILGGLLGSGGGGLGILGAIA